VTAALGDVFMKHEGRLTAGPFAFRSGPANAGEGVAAGPGTERLEQISARHGNRPRRDEFLAISEQG
jgi:hypothetical protein